MYHMHVRAKFCIGAKITIRMSAKVIEGAPRALCAICDRNASCNTHARMNCDRFYLWMGAEASLPEIDAGRNHMNQVSLRCPSFSRVCVRARACLCGAQSLSLFPPLSLSLSLPFSLSFSPFLPLSPPLSLASSLSHSPSLLLASSLSLSLTRSLSLSLFLFRSLANLRSCTEA